jgi:hypothetical protein
MPPKKKKKKKKKEEDVDVTKPKGPPHAGLKGYWIQASSCRHKQSFGVYYCRKCHNEAGELGKKWYSAHAYREFEQQCKDCKTAWYPSWMWVNKSRSYRKRSNKDDKPHRSDLCMACKAGACKAGACIE